MCWSVNEVITEIFAILAGMILLTGLLGVIPALGTYLEKFAKWLGSFQGIIGFIALLFGILGLLNISSFGAALLTEIMCIIAGIMLAIGIIQALPFLGDSLKKVAKFLGGFQVIIGIITFLVGILDLVGVID